MENRAIVLTSDPKKYIYIYLVPLRRDFLPRSGMNPDCLLA